MTARNAVCPCGSGKKYKRCCLMLSTAIKSQEFLNSGETALKLALLDLTVRTLEEMEKNPLNKGKKYGLEDFKILLELSICLWNISFLASSRVKEVLDYVDNEYSRGRLQKITQWARSLNQVTKLMVLESKPSKGDNGYSIEIETSRPDKTMIEENLSLILGVVLDGVDFMVENGGKK